MEHNDCNTIRKNQYDTIVKSVLKLSTQRFHYLNLANDLTNYILMQMMKEPQTNFSEEIIAAIFPQAIEELFQYYHNAAFKYCYLKTQDHSLSEDIAQEAIKQLLASNNTIDDVYAWLRQVTHNLLCKHYQNQSKERKLYKVLCMEASIIQEIMTAEGKLVMDELLPTQMQELLASQEYQDYQHLHSFAKLKDYADSLGISKAVAQKRKDQIIWDLRAKILLAMGWDATREILSFSQYNAILRFIRNLPLAANCKKDERQSKKYPADLASFLEGIERIDDWGISMEDNRKFRLYLFHLDADDQPVLVTFFIVLNRRNTIKIDGYLKNELAGIHPILPNMLVPKHKGKSMWDYETIVSLVDA